MRSIFETPDYQAAKRDLLDKLALERQLQAVDSAIARATGDELGALQLKRAELKQRISELSARLP